MPTYVQFDGGKSVTLDQDFDDVNSQLDTHEAGQFTSMQAGQSRRVTVYRTSIAYIQEQEEKTGY
jgi:hypothetical protein